MRNIKANFITGFLLFAYLGALLSCATDKTPMEVQNSIPQDELAYYNDSFDEMREDLWNRAGYLAKEEQMGNFKLADQRFKNGKLIICTKTGSFSKGGLGTKYAFRGDFDIQLDCRIDFSKSLSGMDQFLNILVIDKGRKISKSDIAFINLAMGEGEDKGWINSNAFINGLWIKGSSRKTGNFHGTLRILRTGKYVTTLYKKKGASGWNKVNTFCLNANDMVFGFQVRNFFNNRTTIRATQSICAEFDAFRINAAQEIIEEEI